MKAALIGAGNLATNLALALLEAGHDIVQVYSRTEKSAVELATIAGGAPVTDLSAITTDADIYIIALKDSVIADVIPTLCKGRGSKVFIHTAGSVPMNVFEGMASHYGVLYPMQTFSKNVRVNFKDIPCFVEAVDDYSFTVVNDLAGSISDKVMLLSSDQRRFLHLAAVFACNFVNHCYEAAAEILEKNNIPFDVMLPLIDETARKVHSLNPAAAQTGPAVRYDQNVIREQAELLKDNPLFRQIYECMSISIHHTSMKQGGRQK